MTRNQMRASHPNLPVAAQIQTQPKPHKKQMMLVVDSMFSSSWARSNQKRPVDVSCPNGRYPANLNSTRIVGGFLGSVAALSGVSKFAIEYIGSGFNQVTRHEPGDTGVSRLGKS
jgi:hypothetical protein